MHQVSRDNELFEQVLLIQTVSYPVLLIQSLTCWLIRSTFFIGL